MGTKTDRREPRVCPRCGQKYTGYPAVSRKDSTILMCPDCGIRESLESIGVDAEEQEKILSIIHASYRPEEPEEESDE